MEKMVLPYVTKFLRVLISADDRVKIFRVDLFLGAPKDYVSHVLIFAESPKMCKIAKFFTVLLDVSHENKNIYFQEQ